MRVARVLLVIVAVAAGLIGVQTYVSRPTPTEKNAAAIARQGPPAYTLPPGKMERAVALGRARRRLAVAGELMFPAELLLVLMTGLAGRMRDAVTGMWGHRWLQGYGFLLLLLLAVQLLSLPVQIWGHRVALEYGLSVQSWGSWLGDKPKLFLLVL